MARKEQRRTDARIFGTALPAGLIDRIHYEAVRRRVPITRLIQDTLDSAIPRVRIVIDQPASVPHPGRSKATA